MKAQFEMLEDLIRQTVVDLEKLNPEPDSTWYDLMVGLKLALEVYERAAAKPAAEKE